jgi:hypothetical protein
VVQGGVGECDRMHERPRDGVCFSVLEDMHVRQ